MDNTTEKNSNSNVVKDQEEFEISQVQICESFDDMKLRDELLRGIYAYGFEKPSAIQMRGIIPVIMGKDTIAQAQSGTGKTATFVISSLQIIDPRNRDCQVLILAPTHELAQQIHKVTKHLGNYMKITSHVCVGGTVVRDDIRIMQNGIQMIIGNQKEI